ncbi:hypothetical protein TMPK1_32140 [Rhodospirillales bacterium TMPK1]|uniref:Uncharacterized protein n=1 Tax=Roseiterribacter gracilis TaxID=2812848 RepID=A0A8S8XHF8_9PROT|nr:hypothetical protein TMPK1_32140 [Rhodospirillales bacterium TMPK1]
MRLNQRVATVAANTSAVRPVPTPSTIPQVKTNCQRCVICSDRIRPDAIISSAIVTTRRTPKRFMNDAANGPSRPNNNMRTASAAEMSAALQPNSRCSGTINTPGAPTAPAVTSKVRKVATTTAQP